MSLDPATVRRIAKLARIRVAEDEVPRLAGELNGILGWIEQLNEVDVEGIDPLTGAAQMAMRLRPDTVTDGGVSQVTVDLKPGKYEFYCPVGDHKEEGMQGTLTVG